MRNYIFLLCLFSFFKINGQTLSGTVVDERGTPIFAANVYCGHNPQLGTTTGFSGEFQLNIALSNCDSLLISYLGYETKKIPTAMLEQEDFRIQLKASSALLEGVEIKASPNVTQEFSVMKMNKLDIYLNPSAAADPLKAITTLPYSTNDDETANPALRGSDPSRSKVFLNGVPVDRPVRNAQLNGVGFFSLFNTALIDEQVVYASNPPLNFGNSSAGLVEIETASKAENNEWQVTAGMANLGLQHTHSIEDKGLVQVYGNWQLSRPFLEANRNSLPDLIDFNSRDFGINAAFKISEESSLRFYSYIVDESAEVNINILAEQGPSRSGGVRNFNILNYKRELPKGWLNVSVGYDWRDGEFQFGQIYTDEKTHQWYSSINWKHYFQEDWVLQAGLSSQRNSYQADVQRPLYYFSNFGDAPAISEQYDLDHWSPEAYLYFKMPLSDEILLGLGTRSTLVNDNQLGFFSAQANLKYDINDKQKILLAGGQYHNISNPGYFNADFQLLSSTQLSLEYSLDLGNTFLQTAAYYKNEEAAFSADRSINGLEFYASQILGKYWQLSFANTFLDVSYDNGEFNFIGENDYHYFIKFTANYNNSSLINFGLSAILRPGRNYTRILGGRWIPAAMAYEPIFSDNTNDATLGSYNAVNLNLSKMFDGKHHNIIAFLSLSNILNTKNEREFLYQADYSDGSPAFFPGFIFYGGVVVNWVD